MNSIKKFMEIFESKRLSSSWLEMTDILKDCDQYFKNVPASEQGVILSILFNERTGLLSFLMNSLEQPHISKDLEGTMIQTLHLLVPILKQFSEDYKPYIKSTMVVLKLALTIKSTWYLKDAAGKTFVEFVKVFKSLDLDFDSVVSDWVKKLHLYSIQERRVLLYVISVIAWHFPQMKAFGRSAKTILRQLMADYRETYEGKKRSVQCLAPYIESLSNILRNFPPSPEDTGSIAPISLYGNLKKMCNSKENQNNKSLMIAAMNLLSEHLSLFGEYVYEDYELWRLLLEALVRKGTYGDVAIDALRNYYRTVGAVLGRKNSPNDKKVFLNLRDSFLKSLENDRISSTELRLTVYGFSQIIEPCKNHLASAGVEEMFSLIAHRTIPLFSREDDETARYEEIADYQVALSRIIRSLENVSIDQMRALATLCTLMIKHFPELTTADQRYAITCLNTTIINVRYTKETLRQDFITNIIYDGIVWSCSHMLLIDAELQRDADEHQALQHRITYKDYVPLWCGLLNPENYTGLSENSETRVAALRTVVDEIVTTCVSLLRTLNLDVTASNENSVFNEATSSRIPVNKADFRIFLNLVDLYVEILPCIESHFFTSDLSDALIREIIKHSYKSPSISGFYKLASTTLASSSSFAHCDPSRNDSYDLVLQYLWSVIEALPRYPQELQISCLQLVLDAPEPFVPRIADRAVAAFRISLTLGLTNYEIASTSLAALERWHECPGVENPRSFVSQIVPHLAIFLQGEESSERLMQDIEDARRRGGGRRSGGGRGSEVVTVVDDERTVEAFQKRILLFLGSLDYEVTSSYIHERSMKTGATWSKKNLLEYSIPFPDTSLDIHLDRVLPRIIELAQSSGDRRTRLAACEVLHTVVAFVLGKTVHFLTYDKDRFATIYEMLFPVLLKLSCDPDDVVMQLYHPLTMQITHWTSSTLMLDSLVTTHLVDALFDGLSDETSSSLRDLSGVCLAEFVLWSIKQSSDRSLAKCPTNIHLILRRIVDFALDPTPGNRVAAAIAFNHLYRIIRERDEIVDVFWLTLLHAFVTSLDGCRDTRIDDSLRHVQRVLMEKSTMFSVANPRRDRPPGFDGSTIVDALDWIFRQCGSLDRNCRRKCMDVFANLSSGATRNETSTPKHAIEEYLRRHNVRGLNDILIGDTRDTSECGNTSRAMTSLLRTFDLYVWLIRSELIDNEILFGDVNPDKRIVFDRIDSLVRDCLATVDADSTAENESSGNLQEFVRSRALRCDTLLTLFDFVLLLLDVRAAEPRHVPDDVFDEKFFSLVGCCLTRPERLGFDSSNLQLTEQLPAKLEDLLNKSTRVSSPELVSRMRDVFAREIEKISEKLFNFEEIRASGASSTSENRVRGLVMLRKCGILKMCGNCDSLTANPSEKVAKIFELLRSEDFGKSVCFYLKSETRKYLESLVELLLIDYDRDAMEAIVKLLNGGKKLYRSDMTVVTHGEYFFGTFRNVLIRGFLGNVEVTLNLLENSIKENPDHVLRTVEAIVVHLQRNRNDYGPIVERCASTLIAKFPVFESSVNNLEYRRNVFLNIYAIVVRLRRGRLLERDTELYRWLLRELVDCRDVRHKIRLLEDFLVCLVDETMHDSPELAAILSGLRNERKVRDREDESTSKDGATDETTSYFQVLLRLLPVTRSAIVLDAIISFSSVAGAALSDDRVGHYLKLYYTALGATAGALRSLEMTYKRFARFASPYERLDVLRYFLLPSLSECDARTIEVFFERNMRELYGIIMEKPTTNIHDRKQLFVSKIAAYNLTEVMFAIVPKERIDSKDSPITIGTRAIGEKSAPGDDRKCSQKIFRSTLPIRQLRAIEGDDREIVRRVHCATYRCCITIVSTTREEKFYLAVFAENRDKDQMIWENIIDVEREYDLRQTSKKYPREREKLVNIRKLERARRNSANDRFSYVKSYDLATSTLNENICAYDLNAVNLIVPRKNDENASKNEVMSLKLEIDDLNEHECMPLICGLLRHMQEAEISSRPGIGSVVLPKWMAQFRASMWSERSNVRLFLLKVVLNCQPVFRLYAQFFLEPVANAIYRCLRENETLNYVVTDALMMLVDWREIAVPNTKRGENLARLTLACLLERSVTAPTRFIVKYNLSIVEMVVDSWHECLCMPDSLNDRITRDDRSAVKFILVFLTNKMADKIVARNDIWCYVLKFLPDWKIEEVSVLQCYEAAGLMLKYSAGLQQYEARRKEIVETLPSVFRCMQISHPGRLVKCIHALCKACDSLAIDFFQFVSSIQLRVEPANIVKCLEVFSLIVPRLSKESVIKELSYMRFNNLLENKVLSCEGACLRIVDQLVGILESEQLLELAKLVVPYSSHEILEYRQSCHRIFVKLYKKYSALESRAKEIMDIGRKVLLSGILDPAEEIQKSSFDFWSDVTEWRDEFFQRFIDILDTYGCRIETNFLQIVTLVLLELTRKAVGFEKKMFEPLHNCAYNDHEISISWKSRSYRTRIPLYAPSLASQSSQRFTQYSHAMGTASFNDRDSQDNYVLRSTEPPQFEATATFGVDGPFDGNETGDDTENGTFALPRIPNSEPRNKLSRRFLEDWSDITVEMKKRRELKRSSELQYGRDYLARQRGRVKLRRKYRIGDFPDVEISHSTLLGPVQELVKRDTRICKDLLVSMVRSLFGRSHDACEAESRGAQISSRFAKILGDGRENGDAVAAILEMLFQAPGLECPWSIVVEGAKNYGLHAQGACLTEQSLIREVSVSSLEPPAKRPRPLLPVKDFEKKDKWIELAGLYELMDELDVVLGIFRGDAFTEDLHAASLARAANDWTRAEDFYRKALETESDEETKQHCRRGTFECLARLGNWKKLEKDLDARMKGNFDNLLTPDSNELRWMAPWIFRTHTQRILESRGNEKFVVAMKKFLNGAASYQLLKEHYGEETAIILCTEKPEVSRDFLNGSWEKVRQMWLRSSALATQPRSRAMLKMRGIHDVDRYLRAIAGSDIAESWRELNKRWRNSAPSIKDDLLAWDVHTSYRLYFCESFVKAAPTSQSQETVGLIGDIRTSEIRHMLRLIGCSLSQKNAQLARKYSRRVETALKHCSDQSLVDEFEVKVVSLKFLEAQTSSDPATSLKLYCSVWELSHEILGSGSLLVQSEIAVRQVISEVSSCLAKIANEREEFVRELAARTKLAENIFSERIDFDNVGESLNCYSFTNLQECCKLAPHVADCHLRLSKYCYESVSSGNRDDQLSREFVVSTLRAMAGGSDEATYYFPCLLKDNILSYDEARRAFVDESANVETWRFLIWQTQLLSHLGTSTAKIVMPIVERLMSTYPDAMVYSVRLALDTSVKFCGLSTEIRGLENFLAGKRNYERFLRAMEHVVSPGLFVEHYLREFAQNLSNDRDRAYASLLEKLYPVDTEDTSLRGNALRDIVASCKSEIEGMLEMPISEIRSLVDAMLNRLRESGKNRRDRNELGFYSPWLSEYAGRDIEVPGRYNASEKPRPRYHAKIVKVVSTIKVMRSIRKPIRITILATDGRSYRFLVKFGEDLRLDQRIEQVFDVMNDKLKSDAACAQRRLSIDTYQVFPLSGSLGLIQWIDGTKTLREYIGFSMNDEEKNRHRQIETAYGEWIRKAAPGKSPSVQYKEALVRYSGDEVRAKLTELTSNIRGDTLRDTFVSLGTCMESFVSLRRNFTTTYATMCLGQWILGIGDRHPANTLLKIESGRCLGIDFGSAFGGGIDQSVPELMPFRLTAQIKGMIAPFNEYDAMGATMIHVLRALKNSKGSLLASLDVVAHEQLNWQEHVYHLSQGRENATCDVKWLPEKKVRIVSKKLDGGKPSSIILEQLAERHFDEKYFPRYVAIVNGTDSDHNHKRQYCRETNLSPEEQVQCLIEQATDFNVLGRTYVGWAPWL